MASTIKISDLNSEQTLDDEEYKLFDIKTPTDASESDIGLKRDNLILLNNEDISGDPYEILTSTTTYAGFITRKEILFDNENQTHYVGKAYLPAYLINRVDVIDQPKYHIFKTILESTSMGNAEITKLAFDFEYTESETTYRDRFEIQGYYRLPKALISLFFSGQELLRRVALTQYGLTQKDRDFIRDVNIQDFVSKNIEDTAFLRLWSILITASVNSTTLLSKDPTVWVDPKIIAFQKQKSEQVAAEFNQYVLEHRDKV